MIERLRPGDKRIPAAGWNAMANAVDAIGLSTGNSRVSRNTTLIAVQNKSGDHVPAFGVLRIAGRVFSAENDATGQMLNNGIVVKGEAPNDDDDQIVCITQESIPKDGIGRAVLWAATGVMVKITDTSHNYAKPIDGDTGKLESTDSGSWRIVDKGEEKGERFCYVISSRDGLPYGFAIGFNGHTTDTIPMFAPVTYSWSYIGSGHTDAINEYNEEYPTSNPFPPNTQDLLDLHNQLQSRVFQNAIGKSLWVRLAVEPENVNNTAGYFDWLKPIAIAQQKIPPRSFGLIQWAGTSTARIANIPSNSGDASKYQSHRNQSLAVGSRSNKSGLNQPRVPLSNLYKWKYTESDADWQSKRYNAVIDEVDADPDFLLNKSGLVIQQELFIPQHLTTKKVVYPATKEYWVGSNTSSFPVGVEVTLIPTIVTNLFFDNEETYKFVCPLPEMFHNDDFKISQKWHLVWRDNRWLPTHPADVNLSAFRCLVRASIKESANGNVIRCDAGAQPDTSSHSDFSATNVTGDDLKQNDIVVVSKIGKAYMITSKLNDVFSIVKLKKQLEDLESRINDLENPK